MKHGLMGKEKIENLGFSTVNTYENEGEVSAECGELMSLMSCCFLVCRGSESCLESWLKLIKWLNGTSIECKARAKLTTICTMFEPE